MNDSQKFVYNFDHQVSRAIQEFIGIAGSIVYDGQLTDAELNYLTEWMYRQGPYLEKYPLTDLKKIIIEIQSDGIVTDEERKRVLDLLLSISPTNEDPVISGIFNENPLIQFQDQSFLFTGDMLFSPRNKAENIVIEKGGTIAKGCTQKLNYLIVGSMGSEFYKFGKFGTKVTKALEYNRSGKASIQIVQEKDFVKAISTGIE